MIEIDLAGRVALVTGAGQGLGAMIAQTLHSAGAAVIINYFVDAEGANQRRAEAIAAQLGDRAAALPADVRNPEQLAATVDETVKRFGRLDIVVNNAGVLRDRTLKKMTPADWQQVIDTNLTGVFNVCQAAAPALADGGRIVNLASISAAVGFFGQSNYAASKAGVIALTKVLSRELARRRITVNAVAPGVVLTDMGKSIPEEVRAEMLKNIPLNRFAEPREIADVVLFLCSHLASYVTGQTLHVNGGWYA
jgi:NAD(P)-dependent dehydrogenase (short-subunit alcohol dehydrogenase family)